MHIRKETPGSAPGFEWTEAGQVHDVPDHLALELLNEPHRSAGGFSEVQVFADPVDETTPEDEGTGGDNGAGEGGGEGEAPAEGGEPAGDGATDPPADGGEPAAAEPKKATRARTTA
jgi:hypothetical protein